MRDAIVDHGVLLQVDVGHCWPLDLFLFGMRYVQRQNDYVSQSSHPPTTPAWLTMPFLCRLCAALDRIWRPGISFWPSSGAVSMSDWNEVQTLAVHLGCSIELLISRSKGSATVVNDQAKAVSRLGPTHMIVDSAGIALRPAIMYIKGRTHCGVSIQPTLLLSPSRLLLSSSLPPP